MFRWPWTQFCALVRPGRGARLVLLSVCVSGCEAGAAAPETSGAGDEGSTTTTGSGTTTYDAPTPCEGSESCAPGFCVAPYDAGGPPGAQGRGDAVCVDTCVPELALDRWCIDDTACCSGLLCMASDGLCVEPSTSSESTVGESWVTLGTGDETAATESGSTDTGGSSSSSTTG